MSVEARRKGAAVLALAGLFLSAYLLLHRLGFYGELICGPGGSCELVQASRYAVFLGVPVAGWGTAWYAALFAVALIGVQPAFRGSGPVGWALALLATAGLLFSAYLTALELFVIRAICRWCVGSAVLTVLIFLLVGIPPRGPERARAVAGSARASAGDGETVGREESRGG